MIAVWIGKLKGGRYLGEQFSEDQRNVFRIHVKGAACLYRSFEIAIADLFGGSKCPIRKRYPEKSWRGVAYAYYTVNACPNQQSGP
jgi:hypothetical protein